jgi:predicted secreted protein
VKVGQNHLADVTKWSATHKSNVTTFGSSDSGGWKLAVAGTEEISGDLEAKLQSDAVSAPISVSSIIGLVLETGNLKLSGNAIVSEIAYEVDIDTGAPVGFKASFVSSGAWTYGGGS